MITIIKEHIALRKIIFKLAKSDLIKTYRGAALGWTWAVIKPTVTILVYWFTFTIGLRAPKTVEGYPYFLWLISGIIPWFFMGEMLTQGTESIRRYRHLVTKMNFPVSTIPTFVGFSKLFVHVCMLSIVIVIFVLGGYYPDIYYFQLPFYMLMMFLLFTAWAIFSAPLAALSKDFSNLVSAFITALFWLSAVIWDPRTVSNKWARLMLKVNPITYLTSGYRDVFIYKEWFFDKKETVVFLVILLTMFILASHMYSRLRKDIPDVL